MKQLSLSKFMCALHRDVGALVIGLTFIFSISGVVLIYRDAAFLRFPVSHEKHLEKNLRVEPLKKELNFRRFKLVEDTAEKIVFANGSYDKATGLVEYTTKSYPKIVQKMNRLHMAYSKKMYHWVCLIYGISLFFLALSSFWMYKPGTKKFKRFMSLTALGGAIALIILAVI